jgi:hypothetical protein
MTMTSSHIGLDETDERLVSLPGGKPSPLGRVGLAARRLGIAFGVAGIVLVPLAGGVAAAGPAVPVLPHPILTAPVPPTHPVCVPCVKLPKRPPVVIGTGGVTPTPATPAPTTPAPTTPAPTPPTPAATTEHSTGADAVTGDTAPLPPVTDPTVPTAEGSAGGTTTAAGSGTASGGSTGVSDNAPLLAAGGAALLVGGLGGLLWFTGRRRAGR